jgi:glutaredoxin
MKTIVFYTKPNCPLCDKALAVLRELQERIPFEIEPHNILEDPILYEKYKHDIPVAELDGLEIFRHCADSKSLEKLLKQNAVAGTPRPHSPTSHGGSR